MLAFSDYLEEKAKKTSVKINPTKEEIKEAMDFEEFDALTDEELEIVMEELIMEMMIDEGLELDEVLDIFGADDMLMEASEGRWERVKSAAKKAGRAIARGAGYVAGVAKRAVKAAGSEMKKGYERGSKGSESSSSSSSSSGSSSSSSSRSSSGSSAPAEPEKDRSAAKARLNRMRMAKVKRGIKKVAGKTARLAQKGASAVSKGADKVAKRLGEENVQYIGGDLTDGGLEVRTWSLEEVHPEMFEGYAPGDVDQKVGAVTAIPKDERDAAKARLLAKAKAKRKEKGLEEGMSMKDFKANRTKLKRRESSADAEKRGHVGKEWHNTGRKYSADDAKRSRANMSDDERSARHGVARDPDSPEGYGASKTKNPKKIRKQKAMGEETILERGDFWHPDPEKDRKLGGPGANQRAREDRAEKSKPKDDSKKLRPGESYMDYAKRQKAGKSSYKSSGSTARERLTKAGAKLSPPREGLRDKLKRKLGLKKEEFAMTEGRAEDAQASLAKVKARQKVLDAHENKTGKKLDITKTPEHKAHKQNFPGAKRTGKKVKGAKETPLETHNRRVNKTVDRIVKKGYTSKEKKEVQSMAKHASRYD